MAKMFITLKIMPDDQDTDLNSIKNEVIKIITDFGGSFKEDSLEPVAFGLKALKIMYLIDESKGVDELCELLSAVNGIGNVEAVDMRRAVG